MVADVEPQPARSLEVEALTERIRIALAPRAEVLEAYLFGSRVRGERAGHSDIDVAVYFDERALDPKSLAYGVAADLTATLMSALGSNDIDVVVLNGAPPLLYHRVLRDGIRFLARDLKRTTTRAGYALSRYCDYVPQLAKIEAAVKQRDTQA